MSAPKVRFILSGEFYDGCTPIIAANPQELAYIIETWADNANGEEWPDGEQGTITIKRMTDEEVEALPDV